MATDDPYLILGIGRDATDAEVRAAFRTAARWRHPDTAETASDGRTVRSTIDAYRLLIDPVSRARYDAAHRCDPVELPVASTRRKEHDSTAVAQEAPQRRGRCGACGGGTVETTATCPSCRGRAEITVLGTRIGRVLTCRTCCGVGVITLLQPCWDCARLGPVSALRGRR